MNVTRILVTGVVAGAAAWAAVPALGAEQEGAGEGAVEPAAVAKPDRPTSTAPRSSATASCRRCSTSCRGRSRCPATSPAGRSSACSTRRSRRSTATSSAARCATTRRRVAQTPAPAAPPRQRRPSKPSTSSHLDSQFFIGDQPWIASQTVIKFFQDCGLFIYPSALIMALGVTIAIERFIFLSKARNQNRKVWAQVLPMLQKGQFARRAERRPRSPTPRSARSSATA